MRVAPTQVSAFACAAPFLAQPTICYAPSRIALVLTSKTQDSLVISLPAARIHLPSVRERRFAAPARRAGRNGFCLGAFPRPCRDHCRCEGLGCIAAGARCPQGRRSAPQDASPATLSGTPSSLRHSRHTVPAMCLTYTLGAIAPTGRSQRGRLEVLVALITSTSSMVFTAHSCPEVPAPLLDF